MPAGDIENLHHHRLDDETVIIIQVECRAIAIPAVALVPRFVAVEGITNAVILPFPGKFPKGDLDHRREKEPVVLSRLNGTRGFHFENQPVPGHRVKTVPELRPGA